MIMMRPAQMADSDMLLAWRNDPLTRALSVNTDPVSPGDHRRWMTMNVENGYPAHLVMIAETDHGSTGVVRFDADRDDVMSYWVSITIAPKLRGRKLAVPVLMLACDHMEAMEDYALLARIKYKNAASIKTFESCDFSATDDDGEYLIYRRRSL